MEKKNYGAIGVSGAVTTSQFEFLKAHHRITTVFLRNFEAVFWNYESAVLTHSLQSHFNYYPVKSKLNFVEFYFLTQKLFVSL